MREDGRADSARSVGGRQTAGVVARDDLVSRWPFRDGFDDVAGGNDAAVATGDPEITTFEGRPCASFDGDAALRVSRGGHGDLSLTAPDDPTYCITMWVNFGAETGSEPLGGTGTPRHTLFRNDTGYRLLGRHTESTEGVSLRFSISPYGDSAANGYGMPDRDAAIVPLDQWHHVAVRVTPGERVQIYVDADPVFEDRMDGYSDPNSDFWTDVTIGGTYGGNPEEWAHFLGGYIADLRVYQPGLDGDGIRQVYENTADRVSKPPTLEPPEPTTTVPTTTAEPTPTPEPDPTPPRPTTEPPTPDEPAYELREGTVTEVRPYGEALYVIRDIPEQPADRRAVTTTDYELVGPELAEDALTAEYYVSNQSTVDYESRLDTARDHRERAADLQLFGRALDAGWDVTVIANGFLVGQPMIGLGNAISLSTDLMDWGYTEYADPFEEGFTKMSATLTNARTIREKAARMRNSGSLGHEIGEQLGGMVSAFSLGADTAATGRGLASAWDEALTALHRSAFPTSGADDVLGTADDLAAQSVDDAVAASQGMFTGFAIGLATGEISSVIQAKTKIHTAELAYESVRIPILERLRELQDRARTGRLTYPLAMEYGYEQATEMQMGAILFKIGAEYWRAISDSASGLVWNLVSDADAKADNYAATARALEDTSKYMFLGLGADTDRIDQRYSASINAEAMSGGGGR